MRVTLASSLLNLLPLALGAVPASAEAGRGPVYLSLMGEPFTATAGQSPLALWLAKADSDRNGMVSLAELTIDADRFFKTLDVDGDGRIGGDEMTRYEQQIAPAGLRAAAGARPVGWERSRNAGEDFGGATAQSRGRGESTGEPQIGPSRNARSSVAYSGSIPQPVAMTDVDMSGSVTTEEFARAAARRFAMYDSDKNGLLDAAELAGRSRARR